MQVHERTHHAGACVHGDVWYLHRGIVTPAMLATCMLLRGSSDQHVLHRQCNGMWMVHHLRILPVCGVTGPA